MSEPTSTRPLSPCIGMCRIDPGYDTCRGCQRTIGEIDAWFDATNDERWAILALVEERWKTAPRRYRI